MSAPCIHDQGWADKLAALSFVTEAVNVILLGPPGVGKTHLAIGLGLKAIERGHRVVGQFESAKATNSPRVQTRVATSSD